MNARELLIHNAQYLTDDGIAFIDEMEYFDENQQEWLPLVGSCPTKTLYLKLRIKPKKTKKQILLDYLCYFDDNMRLLDCVEFYAHGTWQPASSFYKSLHFAMITEYPVRMNGS